MRTRQLVSSKASAGTATSRKGPIVVIKQAARCRTRHRYQAMHRCQGRGATPCRTIDGPPVLFDEHRSGRSRGFVIPDFSETSSKVPSPRLRYSMFVRRRSPWSGNVDVIIAADSHWPGVARGPGRSYIVRYEQIRRRHGRNRASARWRPADPAAAFRTSVNVPSPVW